MRCLIYFKLSVILEDDHHHSVEDQEDQCLPDVDQDHQQDVVDPHLVDDRDHQCADDPDLQLDVDHHLDVTTIVDDDHDRQWREDLEHDRQHLNLNESQLQN